MSDGFGATVITEKTNEDKSEPRSPARADSGRYKLFRCRPSASARGAAYPLGPGLLEFTPEASAGRKQPARAALTSQQHGFSSRSIHPCMHPSMHASIPCFIDLNVAMSWLFSFQ